MDVATAVNRGKELEELTYPLSTGPLMDCDLVMKGGITSGVVYPLAACELARQWKFRSVGGSSAGAIAAGLVAAAEYGRDSGGFQRLATLPGEIGPVLPKLFTPGPRTATAHAAVMAAVDPVLTTTRAKITRVLRVLLRAQRGRFITTALIAAVIGLVAAVVLTGLPTDAATIVRFVVLAVVFIMIGTVIAAALALAAEVRATADGLVAQGFGVCLGSDGPNARPATPEEPGALTDWLSARIDEVAGLTRPLLVADLAERGIDLRVMTTNLTLGQPMTFPFQDRRFLFDPDELAAYFPPAVIAALRDNEAAATEGGRPLLSAAGRPLFRLPEADRLPVVLAARISLSFPGLISAVPLYTVDFSRKDPKDHTAVRCWFSDGGITSNFPIHFFDSLWPSRPTFALDLRDYNPEYPESDVYYSATRPRAPRVTPIGSIPAFASAILTTMQYWADDAQCTLPGYRDRVVEVHLHPEEGGFNLQMPRDQVALLAEKGRQAAESLNTDFIFTRHRWIRYLTSMGRMQDAIGRMDERYATTPPPGGPGVRELIDQAPHYTDYQRSGAWAAKAQQRTETLLGFAGGADPDFTRDAPKPDTVMRITPRF